MCTHPVAMSGFIRKEFVSGKLKPEFALMNKVIHDRIEPKGNEKYPNQVEIQFLYEVMIGKLIDYCLVILTHPHPLPAAGVPATPQKSPAVTSNE